MIRRETPTLFSLSRADPQHRAAPSPPLRPQPTPVTVPAADPFRNDRITRLPALPLQRQFASMEPEVKTMLTFLLWLLLLVVCWPLALLALMLYPIVWLLSLPFRLVGITLSAVFEFLRALLFLPARLLGARPA